MKKFLVICLCLVLSLCFFACGDEENFQDIKEKNDKSNSQEETNIPDVFGINYIDAIEILEAEGFEVKAIETNVEDISVKLLFPLENVTKGYVFKIDNYILDNNGNLTKDYDVFYDGELVSNDKNLVIYYAKDNYSKNDGNKKDDNESAITSSNESVLDTSDKNTEIENVDGSEIGYDFRAAMDSYEEFVDEFVDFMNIYYDNPTDIKLLEDYMDYISKYEQFLEDFEEWGDKDLNDAELLYYIEVQTRANEKILQAI